MKYPLSKSEWKWFILGILMIAGLCIGFGLIMYWIFKDDSLLILSAILGTMFIYGKLILPFLRRI